MSDPIEYHIGIVCAITIEYAAAQLILDEKHPKPTCLHRPDRNSYTLGRVGEHNVVIAAIPEGEYGTVAAAVGSRDMLHSFPNIKIGLVVGVGGGAPGGKVDIRLGDLVVGLPKNGSSGVLQYDFGTTIQNRELQLTRHFDQPPAILRAAVVELRSRMQQGLLLSEKINQILTEQDRTVFRRPMFDRLFRSDILHQGSSSDCQECDGTGLIERLPRETNEPQVHYGSVASADFLMKDAELRDRLSQKHGILCFEMEAAGLVGHFSCLVLKGLSDYSDTHKNKHWQGYAALVAAIYAKELLSMIDPNQLLERQTIEDFSLPFSLPGAPIISTFLGRQADLQRIEELLPTPSRCRRTNEPDRPLTIGHRKGSLSSRATEGIRQTIVICGLGGMGKTQLAIEFAKRHSKSYTAILWLDGKDEPSLQTSFVNVLKKIKTKNPSRFLVSTESIDITIAVELVLRWLNTTYNDRWLMIFDNVDDPDIPGVIDGLYDVRKYIPTTLHGHIIITTRCLLLRLGQQMKLEKIKNRDDCLNILKTVSMRPNLNNGKVHCVTGT